MELNICLGYLIASLGLLLYFTKTISNSFLPLFILPLITIISLIFIQKKSENVFVSQKNIIIIDCVQYLFITTKLTHPNIMSWSMTLVFYIAVSVFICLLGLLLSVILSCALFGFLYSNLPKWKLRSLTWMTFYYLLTGISYIYIIKGVVEYFEDDDYITREQIASFVQFEGKKIEFLCSAALMVMMFNMGLLVGLVCWKKDLIKYVSRVIYPQDLRKEISLRKFRSNFAFRMLRQSAVFFKAEKKCKREGFDNQGIKVRIFIFFILNFKIFS